MSLIQEVKKLVDKGMGISEAYKAIKQMESVNKPVRKPVLRVIKGGKWKEGR